MYMNICWKKSIRGREINRMRWEKKTGRDERKKSHDREEKKGIRKKTYHFIELYDDDRALKFLCMCGVLTCVRKNLSKTTFSYIGLYTCRSALVPRWKQRAFAKRLYIFFIWTENRLSFFSCNVHRERLVITRNRIRSMITI
jgi:hypothetical protein